MIGVSGEACAPVKKHPARTSRQQKYLAPPQTHSAIPLKLRKLPISYQPIAPLNVLPLLEHTEPEHAKCANASGSARFNTIPAAASRHPRTFLFSQCIGFAPISDGETVCGYINRRRGNELVHNTSSEQVHLKSEGERGSTVHRSDEKAGLSVTGGAQP
jgi:hypothetical protein